MATMAGGRKQSPLPPPRAGEHIVPQTATAALATSVGHVRGPCRCCGEHSSSDGTQWTGWQPVGQVLWTLVTANFRGREADMPAHSRALQLAEAGDESGPGHWTHLPSSPAVGPGTCSHLQPDAGGSRSSSLTAGGKKQSQKPGCWYKSKFSPLTGAGSWSELTGILCSFCFALETEF